MMKKLLSIVALSLFALTLAGCNCQCENEDEGLNAAIQTCTELGGTHDLIHSQTAVYGECSFPSGVICDDQAVVAGECDYTPNTESIDTPENRLASCESNVNDWVNNIENGDLVNIDWEDESEGGASFVRNGEVKYVKEGNVRTMSVECVSDFVDGSTSISFGNAVMEGSSEDLTFEEAYDEAFGEEFPEGDFPEEEFPEGEFPEE